MLAASKDFHILNPKQLMFEIRLGLYSSVESLLNSLKNNVWADCHSYPKLSNLKQWNVRMPASRHEGYSIFLVLKFLPFESF